MALWKLSRYFADIVARRMIAGPMGASRLERSIKGMLMACSVDGFVLLKTTQNIVITLSEWF